MLNLLGLENLNLYLGITPSTSCNPGSWRETRGRVHVNLFQSLAGTGWVSITSGQSEEERGL